MREAYALLENRLSVYESYNTILLVLAITAGTLLISLYWANSRRTSVATVLSNLTGAVIPTAMLALLYFTPAVTVNNRYLFLFYLPLLLNSVILLLTIFEYIRLQKQKNFDIDHISRFHFNSSLSTGIAMILGALALIAFIPGELAFIISVSLLTTLLNLTATHLIVRRYIRE